ncbi:hypothetical protein OA249_02655 [Litorivicinus sp.]|nr:hypothetical protein [Litorivicinus sp.]
MLTRNVQTEVDFFSQFVSLGDVGAHIGDSTLAFVVSAGIDVHVYGPEPNPAKFQILTSFCLSNRSRLSITLVPWVLGLADGSSNCQYGDSWLGNGDHHEESF